MSPISKQVVEKRLDHRQFNHFSHGHPLTLSQLHRDYIAVCSCCEHEVSGPAYICTKPKCGFLLHDLCFDLTRRLRHRSHSKHPLVLLHAPPSGHLEFTCNACGDSGHGFAYHCEACGFVLHVECASLPEFEIRHDHKHPLVLLCELPEKVAGCACYVCNETVGKGRWMYSCLACGCAAHLDCVVADI